MAGQVPVFVVQIYDFVAVIQFPVLGFHRFAVALFLPSLAARVYNTKKLAATTGAASLAVTLTWLPTWWCDVLIHAVVMVRESF